ncbi:MAG: AMP-binding protein, partial [Actinomycetota bacterium]
VSIDQIFRNPTVRQLAAVVTTGAPSTAPQTEPFALIDEGVRLRLPGEVVDAFPMSAALAGLYVESARPSRYRVYRTTLTVDGPFDPDALQQRLDTVVARHPILRSCLWAESNEQPIQIVRKAVNVSIDVVDLRDHAPQERTAERERWREEEMLRRFDWFEAPLLRVTVHLLTNERFDVTLAEPFLDGYSAALVLSELLSVRPADEEPIEVRGHAEHLAEQAAAVDGPGARFWSDHLDGHPEAGIAGLGSDVEHPAHAEISVEFDSEVSTALAALNRATGVPIKSMLLAAHVRALSVLSGTRDVVTAVMANARPPTADGASMVGLFLNPVPLRIEMGEGSWWDLVEGVRRIEGETLAHRAHPYVELTRARLVDGVDALFNFTHFHPYQRIEQEGIFRVGDRSANDQTYFALTAQFEQNQATGAIGVRLETFGLAPTAELRAALTATYDGCVRAIAARPDAAHHTDPLVSTARPAIERALRGEADREPRRPLHARFVEVVARRSNATAVIEEDATTSFGELSLAIDRVATALRASGVGAGEPVAVSLDRSSGLLAALLGVVAVGAVYVPIDPALPLERRRQLVRISGARWGIGPPGDAAALGVDALALDVADDVGPAAEPLPVHIEPDSPACLIFTSGSTGVPKGVVLSHGSIDNRLAWGRARVPFGADDVIGARTPIGFVDSITELFAGPLSGAATFMVPSGLDDPDVLLGALRRGGVTRATFVPSLLPGMLAVGADLADRVPALRSWTFSGEPLPTGLATSLLDRLPGATIDNLYGSTEVTGDVTGYRLTGDESRDVVPLGTVVDDSEVAVLDCWGQSCPPGVQGEIAVTGAALANGYWHDRELTADRFGSGIPGPGGSERTFRTGDLGVIEDGNLHYLGRLDRQLKVRGVRLEPAEIERCLSSVPSVAAAIVVGGGAPGASCVAYLLLADPSAVPSLAELRASVHRELPTAAVPGAFFSVPHIPTGATGKVDRRALSDLGTRLDVVATEPDRAPTAVEQELLRMWRDRLRRVDVRITDDFFELGGNSLHAVGLAAEINDLVGIDITVGDVFRHATLAEQSVLVEERLIRSEVEQR